MLDEFAEAIAQGNDVGTLMPQAQQHIEMCPDCREEFDALLRVVGATQSGA